MAGNTSHDAEKRAPNPLARDELTVLVIVELLYALLAGGARRVMHLVGWEPWWW